MLTTTVLADGFAALECPRWRDGRLWFSDMHGGVVYSLDVMTTRCEPVVEVNGPGGIGFLPDGRLLVVSQRDRQVLRLDPDGLTVHADLGSFGDSWLNDMWVDATGTAYIGEMGFDVHAFGRGEGVMPSAANVYVVTPDGTVRVGAEDLYFPNGIVIDDSNRTLLVAESFGFRVSSFLLEQDGSMSAREVWASLDFAPDGITLDEEGFLWVADPQGQRAVRIGAGGDAVAEVSVDRTCLSCAIGGDDGAQLFICTTADTDPHTSIAAASSRVEVANLTGEHR